MLNDIYEQVVSLYNIKLFIKYRRTAQKNQLVHSLCTLLF